MRIYKVGGAVRDRLLGKPVVDTDWVVVGSTSDQMLAKGYRPVGMDFPVFLHPLTGEEYALARTERKVGQGYGGFVFHAAPEVTLEEDLIRRDLTINAIAEDEDGTLIDPYQGQRDLRDRVLRHVSDSFAEDPLRVLRVARFAARYAADGFKIADETLALMQKLSESGELLALTPERSWKEISRALMESEPQVFFQVLHESRALGVLFPEIEALFERARAGGRSLAEQTFAALHQAALDDRSLPVRWACALYAVGADDEGEAEKQARAASQRFKVPKECQELSQLLVRHQQQAWHAQSLRPEALIGLLQDFDVYRRPQRFDAFVQACSSISTGARGEDFPQARFLLGAAEAAGHVAVQPLMDRGFSGKALGDALKHARLEALTAYTRESGSRLS